MVCAGVSLGLAAAGVLSGGAPAYASGGSVYLSGTTLVHAAEPGYANRIDIRFDGIEFVITDTGAPLSAGTGCAQVTSHQVSCTAAGIGVITVWTGDLDDTLAIQASTAYAKAYGGAGDDVIDLQGVRGTMVYGQEGNDIVYGSTAGDTIYGGAGDDRLYGFEFGDLLVGGEGADMMSGGSGYDTVSYADHTTPVVADADSVTGDDGALDERDTIRTDVEKLVGGSGNDLLIGTDRSDELSGGAGDDILVGSAGDDVLSGDAGTDRLYGDEQVPVRYFNRDICEPGADGGATAGCEIVR
ncbi:hypothetical protein GCM10027290_23480 [Micromonospora sonneratiae]